MFITNNRRFVSLVGKGKFGKTSKRLQNIMKMIAVCDVINFKINKIFLIKLHDQKVKTKT